MYRITSTIRHRVWLLLVSVLLVAVLPGCSRTFWREQADRDSYDLTAQQMTNPEWEVPRIDLSADPRSRFFEVYNLDHLPLPPDDEAANALMLEVGGWKGYKNWHKFGRAFSVENPQWLDALKTGSKADDIVLETSSLGVVSQQAALSDLTLDELMELAYIHNRDYQSAIEDVYLQALVASRERFQLGVRYLGAGGRTPGLNSTTTSVPGVRDSTSLNSNFGISQSLPWGAQWLVELTNSTLWVFQGGNTTSASAISFSMVQPLLRGSGRIVNLEALTQAERSLLYAVRDLARFRKIFFSGVTTGDGGFSSGYLGLLQQVQLIANQRDNLARLRKQVAISTVLNSKGLDGDGDDAGVFSLSISQLRSQITSQENNLRSSERSLQDSYDSYKIALGLPPDLTFSINTELLKQFELIDPEIQDLVERVFDFKATKWGDLYVSLAEEGEPPPDREYHEHFDQLLELIEEIQRVGLDAINSDFEKLAAVRKEREDSMTTEERERFAQDIARDRTLYQDAADNLQKLRTVELSQIKELLDQPTISRQDKEEIYLAGSKVYDDLNTLIQSLQVVQVNQRVESVILQDFDMTLEEVTQRALETRLDLKNFRAAVVDTRRQVELAANSLESNLNLRLEGDVRTPANRNTPLDFQGASSSYRAGIEFDTPLDQIDERNAYRAALIAYQRARREYMRQEDLIKLQVRQEWRQLEVLKQNFETSRQSVRLAAIQLDNAVESAIDPKNVGGNQNQGVNLLNALRDLLSAQNGFIGNWVNYEQNRINIYKDMGIMELDDRGIWIDPYYQSLSKSTENPPATSPTTPPDLPDLPDMVDFSPEFENSRIEAVRSEENRLYPITATSHAADPDFEEVIIPAAVIEQKTDFSLPRKGIPGGEFSLPEIRPRRTREDIRNDARNSDSPARE